LLRLLFAIHGSPVRLARDATASGRRSPNHHRSEPAIFIDPPETCKP
jgi:hypothetical protein